MVLCLSFVSMTVFAATATATVSGPATVEVGESVNVTLSLSGTNLHGLQGKLSYDAAAIKVNSVTAAAAGWSAEAYGNNFLAMDNDGEHPINQSAGVVTVNVTLLAGDAGSTVTVKFVSLVATDATADQDVSDATYSFTVAAAEEPSEPTEPSEEPSEPTTPAKPVEPSKPSKPTTKPTEPAATEPSESTTPSEPAKPSEPTAPSEPATEPAGPGTEPTEPVTPGDGEHKCNWWWLWILLVIICLVIAYFVGKKIKEKRAQA